MASLRVWRVLLALAGLLSSALGVQAQGQPKIVTLGADLSPDQRNALMARFGATDGVDQVLQITTPEMVEAMRDIIPVAEGTPSISSTAFTCGAPGSGLRVTTENITRVTAGMYAGALLVAGIVDGELVVAAPPEAASEGMTALTGIFKGFTGGACGRAAVDPVRRELAYRWLSTTADLANALGDQVAAVRLMLSANQQLIDGGMSNPAAVEPAFNNAGAELGIAAPPEVRPAALDLLRRVAEARLDWGAYATGWDLQEAGPNEVRLVPHGALPPLSGTVRTGVAPGSPLVINVPGQVEQLNLNAANVAVTRNDLPAQLSDLQVGDTVTIHLGSRNVAVRLEARGGDAAGGAEVESAATGRLVIGTVEENNEGQLTVNTMTGGRQQFVLGSGTSIAREGEPAELGAIEGGDSAVLVLDPTGAVASVFTRSAGGEYVVEGEAADPPLAGQTLRMAVGDHTVDLPAPVDGLAITRDGADAGLSDIQAGDRVVVRFSEMSQPTVIEATSSSSFGRVLRSPWLLLLCLLPLLALAAFFLLGRGRRPAQALLVLPGRRRVVNTEDIDDLTGDLSRDQP